jgi:hypothetical protein
MQNGRISLERKGGLRLEGLVLLLKRREGRPSDGEEGDVELGASIARYGAWRRRVKVAETGSSYRFGKERDGPGGGLAGLGQAERKERGEQLG